MSGNVWEWCQDWYEYYTNEMQIDPIGPAGGSWRISRGGYWNHGTQQYCRSAFRCFSVPYTRGDDIGFRLLRQYP